MNFEEIKKQWPAAEKFSDRPIAYFCAEFALADELPLYSGGLGVLAGDVVRQAGQWRLPLVGIGLLYKQGYFKQVISQTDGQDELPAYFNLAKTPVSVVLESNGQPAKIVLPIADRKIYAQIWQSEHGGNRALFLDTDVPENSELDRRLTLHLYPSDPEWRIQQEMILGIGGVRALFKLGISPAVYHLNEGHSAFAVMEIAHQKMEAGGAGGFAACLKSACSQTVFTNHTLIPSGNDLFDKSTVSRLLKEYADHLNLPVDEITRMGEVQGQAEIFSMTQLALHASFKSSAVSRSHARFAQAAWPETPLIPITNGVNREFWQQPEWSDINFRLSRGLEVQNEEIWDMHIALKKQLIREINRLTGRSFSRQRLTIGWARRIAAYKQPLLLFSDPSRLAGILRHPVRPIQIIMAGKAHPADTDAKAMILEIQRLIRRLRLADHIVFLPDYSLRLAQRLTSGSDVWLNTPIKGQEACGTSGMKAGLNGVLQCAVSDGWTDEIDLQELGFAIDPANPAENLYPVLEQIAKMYYAQPSDGDGNPAWIEKQKKTVLSIGSQFTTRRMMLEYLQELYLPALELGTAGLRA